jgi:hypothetical protein
VSASKGFVMSDPVPTRIICGSCHCGNVRFTLEWPNPQRTISARVCGCAFCTKHGAAWTSNSQGRFDLQITDDNRVARYQFGTKTADFYVCLTCGVVPIVTCAIEGRRYGVFNVKTFSDLDRSELAETATSFEGESTQGRLARRRRNWTPEAIDHLAKP